RARLPVREPGRRPLGRDHAPELQARRVLGGSVRRGARARRARRTRGAGVRFGDGAPDLSPSLSLASSFSSISFVLRGGAAPPRGAEDRPRGSFARGTN